MASKDRPGAPPVSGCKCDGCKSARKKLKMEKAEKEGKYAPRGGTETYHQRHGPEFEENRIKALERAGYECERCGISQEEHLERDDLFPPGGGLHIHHISPTTEFENREKMNALDNLEVLCAGCHLDR